MTKEKPTIESAFETFKQRCLYYQKLFELSFWKINFNLLPMGKECLARTKANPIALVAELELNEEVPMEYLTPDEIDRGARHEMIHLLTRKLRMLADERFTLPADINMAEEELTKRLETIIKVALSNNK